MREHSDPEVMRVIEAVCERELVNWDAELRGRPELAREFESVRTIESLMDAFARLPVPAPREAAAPGSDYRPMDHSGPTGPLFPVMDTLTETADAEAAPAEDGPEQWGHLRSLEKTGEGSYGEVYRAYDPNLDVHVALKLWRRRANGVPLDHNEMLSEARRLARVRHENVLVVHGADRFDGRAGMWMDWLDGETLEMRLEKQGVFSVHETIGVGIDLCKALSAVHGAGLMHRDIKAANVMRTSSGKVVLMDFGSVSRLTQSGTLNSFTIKGTPLVMAPEQLLGDQRVDRRADLYSVGVLLYRLLTGQYPVYAGTWGELARKHGAGEIVPLLDRRPDLLRSFVDVVEKAMDPDPQRRYASAGAMERALREAVLAPVPDDSPRALEEQNQAEAVYGGVGRRWWRTALDRPVLANPTVQRALAVALVLGIAVVAYLLGQRGRDVPAGATGSSTTEVAGVVDGTNRGAGQVAGLPVVPQRPPLSVKADLFRETPGGAERLLPGARVAAGDGLWLEIEGNRAMYVYVFNEDATGRAFVLFPNPDYEARNPLDPGKRHRLPGVMSGNSINWRMDDKGTRETVVVIAATTSQADVEQLIHDLRKPTAVGMADTPRPRLRGLSEVVPSLRQLDPVLDRLPQSGADPWVWRIELEKPRQ